MREPPRWATFSYDRSPRFKVHGTLGQAKNAVQHRSQNSGRYVTLPNGRRKYENPMMEWYVYEAVEGEWVLRWSIAPGDWPSEHPLFTYKEKVKAVSDLAVERAIASIQKVK